MEYILSTIVDHYQDGNRQGGNEVDQYTNFKDFFGYRTADLQGGYRTT
jgi:hypothetical protein